MRAPRSLLLGLAVLFAAAATLYSLCWVYYIRLDPPVMLGIIRAPDVRPGVTLQRVVPEGGAERAGLQAGDRILAINGRSDDLPLRLYEALFEAQPGDLMRLQVMREGWEAPREVVAVLQERDETGGAAEGLPQWVALEVLGLYPLPFLIVGFTVLLLRPEDRNAWLLALVFAGFIASAPLWQLQPRIAPALLPFLFAWGTLFGNLMPAAFYWFFSTFPAPSPIDRRVPWLKTVLVAIGATLGLAGAGVVLSRGPQALERLYVQVLGGPSLTDLTAAGAAFVVYALAGQLLGLGSLALNAFGPPETRRKVRVIVAGSLVGLMPGLIAQLYAASRGLYVDQLPFWAWSSAVLALFLVPLSFAYAVLKHRVLELPVLLRRSARYLLVRRGVVTITFVMALGAMLLLTELLARWLPVPDLGRAAGLVFGAAAGLLVGVGVARALQPITARIDRAFFRESYNARQIMQSLAERSRTLTDRDELAGLLETSLSEALHPTWMRMLLRDRQGSLSPVTRAGASRRAGADEPELTIDIQGRDAEIEGRILLGPRLSDEPYSGEDRELIGLVATQAGITLENIRLAESMAERMEAERRSLREMEIARDVQIKLLPQKMPELATLECAGICLQARAVGGDYYDFLHLGAGRVALVLADVSGKGISAALLMASLQATLRAQYAQPSADLTEVLTTLNRIFYESTAPAHYATVFVGIYDDARRRLQYANCGHLPPVLRRREGDLTRLAGTAPAVGLFDEWTCTTQDVEIAPGDTLVIFSDGVIDALDGDGEEFGEERLLQLLRGRRDETAGCLLQTVVDRVTAHAGPALFDDLTLVVARGREAGDRGKEQEMRARGGHIGP